VTTPGASPSPSITSPAPGTASAPVASAGHLLVGQKGTLAGNLWYLRIESAKGANLNEQAFPAGSIALDKPLPQGDYRVISWRRTCTATCPSTGDKGLGPLQDVCGALVHISTGKTAQVKVAINPDGSCSISKTA